MVVTSIASTATALSQHKRGNYVQIAVLKKFIEIAGQEAQQLIVALPQPQANNPVNSCKSVDTYA
jgi:hypothetical protein